MVYWIPLVTSNQLSAERPEDITCNVSANTSLLLLLLLLARISIFVKLNISHGIAEQLILLTHALLGAWAGETTVKSDVAYGH